MKTASATLFVVSILAACTSNKNQSKDQPPEDVADRIIVESPFPTIAVGKGPDALYTTPDYSFLYVANVEDTIISVIDIASDEVVKTINGIRYPWGFTQLASSNNVAISGYDKQIVIVDSRKHEVIQHKQFESNLGGITSSSDGQYIYVIAISDKQVLKLNLSLEVVTKFSTGKGPDGIGISMDDKKVYVTNTEDGTISIIHTETNESEVVRKGGKPELIHANKNNSLLLISNFSNNEAYLFNTISDSIIHTIGSLDGPEEIVMSNDGTRIYIVNFSNQKVYVYEASDYTKLDIEYVVGAKPIGFRQVSNQKAYVSNYGDNTVSVITLKN